MASLQLPAAAPCANPNLETTALERLLRGWQCNNETATDLQGLGLSLTPTPPLALSPTLTPTLTLTLARRPTYRV